MDWPGLDSVKGESPGGVEMDFETESNWFLEPLGTAAKANELMLIHCGLCERIVLSERFHLHSCQKGSCEKTFASLKSHPAKSVPVQEGEIWRRGNERKNFGKEPEAKKPSVSQLLGSKKKGLRKKGTGSNAGNKRRSGEVLGGGDSKGGLEKCFCFSNWDARSGRKMKTRKLTDVLKNGPKSIPCHLVPCFGFDTRKSNMVSLHGRSDTLGGEQGVDGWRDELKWPQDNARQLGSLVGQKWCNEWSLLSLTGELKFPNEVRKQRSTHPIRRSRYPSPSATVDEGPDVLIDTSSLWYTVAFDPLNESLGSVTVLGCG